VFDFDISPEDMSVLETAGQPHRKRLINPPFKPMGAMVFTD
jgi:hypothetical protein